jgi:hypothetical protein
MRGCRAAIAGCLATPALPLSRATDQKHSMAEVEKKQTQDAFREGLFVRALGRACSSNPYPPDSDEHALWEKGWRSVDENVPPPEAGHRIKLVPEFMPGARANAPRRGLLKLPESFALLAARFTNVLRVLVVVALIVFMLAALRW